MGVVGGFLADSLAGIAGHALALEQVGEAARLPGDSPIGAAEKEALADHDVVDDLVAGPRGYGLPARFW